MLHYIKVFELSLDILAKMLGCSCRTCIRLYDNELELEGNILVLTTESPVFVRRKPSAGSVISKTSVTSKKSLVQSSDAVFWIIFCGRTSGGYLGDKLKLLKHSLHILWWCSLCSELGFCPEGRVCVDVSEVIYDSPAAGDISVENISLLAFAVAPK